MDRSQLSKYFLSPSAKKCSVKGRNCFFCNVYVEGNELWEHLLLKSTCRQYYSRFLKTRGMGLDCVKSIMVKLYNCISCQISCRIMLKTHLLSHESCREYYQTSFEIEDISQLCSQISRLKLLKESKRARALRFEEKKIKMSTAESLNNYRNSVRLANYKTCIKCQSNCTEYGASEVFSESIDLDLNATELFKLRRNNKFWLCNDCCKGGEMKTSSVSNLKLNYVL